MDSEYSQDDLKKKGMKQKYAYDYIKQGIITGKYRPGDQLLEKDLCEELGGLSRTPVKDSLLKLSYEGFVENVPGHGMCVTDLKFEDLFEVFEMRIPVEKTAVRLFIERADEAERARLYELHSLHEAAWEKGDLSEAVELDNEFHKFISTGSKNRLLQSYVEQLLELGKRSAYYTTGDRERVHTSHTEHGLILDGIRKNDADEAMRRMEDHIVSWSQYLLEIKMKQFWKKPTR